MNEQEQALKHLVECVRSAGENARGLRIKGGGSKRFLAPDSGASTLDTVSYRGVVEYQPTELVITARCGTPLAELEAELASHGQYLACEPPHFSSKATFGGAIASGLSGPGRAARGAMRDFVLGVTVLDGRAQILRFGGKVMKNVAGYDAARLFTGSMGRLGVILEASVKVLPRPTASATLVLERTEEEALAQVNELAARPLPITASCWRAGQLALRLSGARAAVEAAGQAIGGERMQDQQAEAFWLAVREQTDDFFAGDAPLWRISVPSSAPTFGLDGATMLEWGGALRWSRSRVTTTEMIALAASHHGSATVFRGPEELRRMAQSLQRRAPIIETIEERLRQQFDPLAIFNPAPAPH